MKDDRFNMRCSEDFNKRLEAICEYTKKNNTQAVEKAVELFYELIEAKKTLQTLDKLDENDIEVKVLVGSMLLRMI